jgi:hypothetical protein
MRSSIQLLEEILRDLTAMHLKLVSHRSTGRNTIGGTPIEEMIAEIDACIRNGGYMLACFKAELEGSEAATVREKDRDSAMRTGDPNSRAKID